MSDIHADLYNPKSKYKEEEKIAGLTLYDIERKPRPKVKPLQFIQAMSCTKFVSQVTGPRTQTLSTRKLNAEFTCPICLGILHNTQIVSQVQSLSTKPGVVQSESKMVNICSTCSACIVSVVNAFRSACAFK
jgi:hypothetical protein